MVGASPAVGFVPADEADGLSSTSLKPLVGTVLAPLLRFEDLTGPRFWDFTKGGVPTVLFWPIQVLGEPRLRVDDLEATLVDASFDLALGATTEVDFLPPREDLQAGPFRFK